MQNLQQPLNKLEKNSKETKLLHRDMSLMKKTSVGISDKIYKDRKSKIYNLIYQCLFNIKRINGFQVSQILR